MIDRGVFDGIDSIDMRYHNIPSFVGLSDLIFIYPHFLYATQRTFLLSCYNMFVHYMYYKYH